MKTIGILLITILLIAAGYLLYLFADYDRIPDQIALDNRNNSQQKIPIKKDLKAMTFNIGYGAYTSDYTFFMDGGKISRAKDKETVEENLTGIIETTEKLEPHLAFFQEVDQDGDRSQHVDEVERLQKHFSNASSTYGKNYHSSYLFYPFLEPIGKATSGLVTISKSEITETMRYSLPIETNFNKFFDLDRAFIVSRIPTDNEKELIAINVHLSAYSKDPTILEAQLSKLTEVMNAEYQKGNYVLVAGDFNHDMLGNSPDIFEITEKRKGWDQPFPEEKLPQHFSHPKGKIAERKIPSARNLDSPYQPGKSYVTVLDGFLISDNISAKEVVVSDEQFKNSDHNPVLLTFQLN